MYRYVDVVDDVMYRYVNVIDDVMYRYADVVDDDSTEALLHYVPYTSVR